MNAPLSREEAISLRVAEIMEDGANVAELIDKINQHGVLPSRALRAGLMQWAYGATTHIRERGQDQALQVVSAFAFLQATNEYDALPLARGVAP